MAEPIEELMRAESRLNRSGVGAIIGAVPGVGWMVVGTRPPAGSIDLDWVYLAHPSRAEEREHRVGSDPAPVPSLSLTFITASS